MPVRISRLDCDNDRRTAGLTSYLLGQSRRRRVRRYTRGSEHTSEITLHYSAHVVPPAKAKPDIDSQLLPRPQEFREK